MGSFSGAHAPRSEGRTMFKLHEDSVLVAFKDVFDMMKWLNRSNQNSEKVEVVQVFDCAGGLLVEYMKSDEVSTKQH